MQGVYQSTIELATSYELMLQPKLGVNRALIVVLGCRKTCVNSILEGSRGWDIEDVSTIVKENLCSWMRAENIYRMEMTANKQLKDSLLIYKQR